MSDQNFRNLIAARAIERVILLKRYQSEAYELWAFGEGFPSHLSRRLNATRPDQRKIAGQGSARTWVSVDGALAYIRQCGWHQTVEVENQGVPPLQGVPGRQPPLEGAQ